MFNVTLAGGHLYGKQLFAWLSLVVSLMASTLQQEQLYQIILKSMQNLEVMARTSSIYDHLIIWPLSVTLIFNLSKQE